MELFYIAPDIIQDKSAQEMRTLPYRTRPQQQLTGHYSGPCKLCAVIRKLHQFDPLSGCRSRKDIISIKIMILFLGRK